MKKLILIPLILTAVIRSSEVKLVAFKHYQDWRLCAKFDVLQENKIIDSSSQCGVDWKDIEEGISEQLQRIKDKEELDEYRKDFLEKLYKIKNDEIGHSITLK